jgi:hypothetical protein
MSGTPLTLEGITFFDLSIVFPNDLPGLFRSLSNEVRR